MTTEIGPVNIQLTSSGITEVINAFQNVENRAAALERKLDQMSQSGSRKRVKTAKDEVDSKNREHDREAKAAEKTEQDKTKAAEKWAKQREQIIHNSAMMAGRLAKQQADAEIKEAQRSANARTRMSQQLAGRIVNDFRSTLGHATRIFGTLMALGGGLSLANSFSNEMKISKSAMALEIASDVPGHPGEKINAKDATARARQFAIEYGTSTSDILETQHAIIAKTGRGKQSQELLGDVMKIATAEGADPKELGTAVATAIAQNPKLTNEEARNLMKMMVDQGKVGAIEIKDMAKILPVLTKTSAAYGGNQSDAQARLVTMVQTAIQTTGGPEQAAVAVSRFTESMASKKGAAKMKAAGFDVYDKNGQLKPVDQLMENYLKAGGGTAQGSAALGILDGRAKSLALAFQGTYQASIKEGKTKEQAAKDAMKVFREELAMRATDAKIESDLKKVQSTEAFQVAQNMEKLNQAIGKELAPVLTKLIGQIANHADDIGKVMKGIGEFISWAANHPWKAAGLAVAAALAKAVAAEVLASGLRKILSGTLGGGIPGGSGGVGGASLAGPTIATAASTALVIGNAMIKTEVGKEEAMDLAAKVRAWQADPKNPNAISPQEAQKRVDAAKARLKKTNAFEQAANLLTSPFVEASDRDYGRYKADQGLTGEGLWGGEDKAAKDLQKAIDDANKMHDTNTKATDRNTAAIEELNANLAGGAGIKKTNKQIWDMLDQLNRGPGGNLHK